MIQEKPVLEYSSSGTTLGIDKTVKFYLDGKLDITLKGHSSKSFESIDRRIELLIPQQQVVSYADKLIQAGFFEIDYTSQGPKEIKPLLEVIETDMWNDRFNKLRGRLEELYEKLPEDMFQHLLKNLKGILNTCESEIRIGEILMQDTINLLVLNYQGNSKEIRWKGHYSSFPTVDSIVREIETLVKKYE